MDGILERLHRSVAAVALTSAALYVVFVAALWDARGRDISRFIVLGAGSVDRSQLEPGLAVVPGGGYDGTAFYRLARDPFSNRRTAYGITLDAPAHRQQRILYPLLAWMVSGGQPGAVPWALVLVNMAAITALGTFGAWLARIAGVSTWWGLFFPLYPGFVFSVSRDLSEAVACAFGLGAIAAMAAKRHGLATALLTAAILTRETFVIVGFAAGVVYVIARIRRVPPPIPAMVFIVPGIVFVMWQAMLVWRWGALPSQQAPANFTVPFTEYARAVVRSSSLRLGHRLRFTELAYLATSAGLVLAMIRSSAVISVVKAAWPLYLVLGSMLSRDIWNEDVGYMRILGDLHIAGAAIVLFGRSWARWTLMITTIIVWYYLATHMIKFP